ncbi:MAG: hypothetical protein ABH821_04110 [archaeon]
MVLRGFDGMLPMNEIKHLIVLTVLVVGLLFMVTFVGVLRCSQIPGWCDVYYLVMGKPDVLIVAGASTGNVSVDGLGNPELLQQLLMERINVRARTMSLDLVSASNLRDFDVVIVERAKKMSTNQLKAFVDYSLTGRLVWVADAGTVLAKGDEPLYYDERDNSLGHSLIGPWARKDEGKQVNFDKIVGVNYIANYCNLVECDSENPYSGNLLTYSEHPLVSGLRQNLKMTSDFAIVKENSTQSRRIMTVNHFTVIDIPDQNISESVFPLIITAGTLNERVVYYAFPPENLAEPEDEEKYYNLVENMYYGMIE